MIRNGAALDSMALNVLFNYSCWRIFFCPITPKNDSRTRDRAITTRFDNNDERLVLCSFFRPGATGARSET
jgi:hypothetical protein